MYNYWKVNPDAPACEMTVRGGAEKRVEQVRAKKLMSIAGQSQKFYSNISTLMDSKSFSFSS